LHGLVIPRLASAKTRCRLAVGGSLDPWLTCLKEAAMTHALPPVLSLARSAAMLTTAAACFPARSQP
jgi:hypothetical protein